MSPATSAGSGCTFSATKMKKIITSTGMARKNSTTSVASARTGRWSDSRPVASTPPRARERTAAIANAFRVLPRPRSNSSWMPWYSKGVHLVAVNWPVWNSRYRIQASSASRTTVDRAP